MAKATVVEDVAKTVADALVTDLKDKNPLGMHAAVSVAASAALAIGDHASHGVLSGVEAAIIDLKTRLTAFEQVISDDARALIEKIKAVL